MHCILEHRMDLARTACGLAGAGGRAGRACFHLPGRLRRRTAENGCHLRRLSALGREGQIRNAPPPAFPASFHFPIHTVFFCSLGYTLRRLQWPLALLKALAAIYVSIYTQNKMQMSERHFWSKHYGTRDNSSSKMQCWFELREWNYQKTTPPLIKVVNIHSNYDSRMHTCVHISELQIFILWNWRVSLAEDQFFVFSEVQLEAGRSLKEAKEKGGAADLLPGLQHK